MKFYEYFFFFRDVLKLCIFSLFVYVNCEFLFVFVDVLRNYMFIGYLSLEVGGIRIEICERVGRF